MTTPTYINSTAAVSGAGALTIVMPEGHIVDDLMLLVVEQGGTDTALSISGWAHVTGSPVTSQATPTVNGSKFSVLYKWVTSAAEANISITTGQNGDHIISRVFLIRGVDTTAPFDAVATGKKETASLSFSALGVTTTVDDCLIFFACSRDNDSSSTTAFSGETNTTVIEHRPSPESGAIAGSGGGHNVYTARMATAGATGTLDGAIAASVANAYITVALTPTSASRPPAVLGIGVGSNATASLTALLPTSPGWAEGDILVIFAHTANEDFPTSPPTGWSAVPTPASGTGTAGAAGAIKLHVFWKRAGASESDVVLGDAGNYSACRMISVRGCVETGDPWDVDGTFLNATAGTSVTWPTMTTTVDNTLILAAVAGDYDPAANQSDLFLTGVISGTTIVGEQAFMIDAQSTSGTGGGYSISPAVMVTAGATGTASGTLTVSQVNTGWWGALKPLSTGTTYQQACYATATGSVSIARLNTFLIVASAAASGSVSILRLISKLLSASGTATPSLTRMVSLTLAATASGAVTATQNIVGAIVAQCYATGSGTVSLGKRITKVFATTGTGAVSASQTLVTFVVQQCYATGSGTVSLAKRITKVLTASATGAVTYADAATFKRAFALTGTGTASVRKLIRKTFSVTASATASVLKLARKTLTVTASATASASRGLVATQASTSAGHGTASSSQTFIAKSTALDYARLLIRNVTRNLVRLIRRT